MSAQHPNYSSYWPDPKLNEEQKAKCLLLEITIFKASEDMHPDNERGKYIIGRLGLPGGDRYVRPIKTLNRDQSMHVFVNTIEECFLLACDPEKYGGHWDT